MKCLGVIPARMASTRLPGKPLYPILGKPLVQWVIEGAQKGSRFLQHLIVATDDERIATVARACGVEAVLTPSDLPSGTDRISAAAQGRGFDIILNIQGDEPLLKGAWLDALAAPFESSGDIQMTTLAHALNPDELASPNAVKVVLNRRSEAIYFSRFPIPFSRQEMKQSISFKHVGLYGYRASFLKEFCALGPVPLEQAESLEQLRALYLGAKIHVVPVDFQSWGVDTPEDVVKVEKILKQGG